MKYWRAFLSNIEIFIYKDTGEALENTLFGQRLERYNQAIREETKRKHLVGSQVVFQVLGFYNLSDQLLLQAFEKSAHEIEKLPFYISFSNSDSFYVLAISKTPVGIDAEVLRGRSDLVYDTYLGNGDKDYKKKRFYKKWLEKEAKIKISCCSSRHEMYYRRRSEIVIGICGTQHSNLLAFKINHLSNEPVRIDLDEF